MGERLDGIEEVSGSIPLGSMFDRSGLGGPVWLLGTRDESLVGSTSMMRWALVLVVFSIATSAFAGDARAQAVPPAPSLAFVYDGGGAHVSGDRLRRSLAANLHRPMLRLTDEGVESAVGRLTIAFSPPDRWVIDFVRGDAHTTRTIVLRTSTVGRLTRVAMTIVADLEPPASTARTPSAERGEWIALIGDEILDPFQAAPPRSRRSLALVQELVDPFNSTPGGHRAYDDVIDPWSR